MHDRQDFDLVRVRAGGDYAVAMAGRRTFTRREVLAGVAAVPVVYLGVRLRGTVSKTAEAAQRMKPKLRRQLIAARINATAAIAECNLSDNDPFVWALVYGAHHALEEASLELDDIPESQHSKFLEVLDELRVFTAPLPAAYLGTPIFGTPAAHELERVCRRTRDLVRILLTVDG